MRKFLLATAILFSTTSLFSQSVWRVGVKGGANFSFSNVKLSSNKITAGTRAGFFGGGLLEFSPGDSDSNIKLQLEALYNDMNVNYPMLTVNAGLRNDKINLRQINIPLLMKVVVVSPLTINFGPTFNVNIGGKQTLITQTNSQGIEKPFTKDNYQSFQLGGAVGVTYNLFKGFFVDARYNKLLGHANNMKDGKDGFQYLNEGKVKWDNAQVGIGYLF